MTAEYADSDQFRGARIPPRIARTATMRRVIDGLTEAELDRGRGQKPAETYPDQEYVVRRCLKVV